MNLSNFEIRLVHQNQEDEKNASAFFEETVTFSRTGCSFTGRFFKSAHALPQKP